MTIVVAVIAVLLVLQRVVLGRTRGQLAEARREVSEARHEAASLAEQLEGAGRQLAAAQALPDLARMLGASVPRGTQSGATDAEIDPPDGEDGGAG